MDETVSLVPSEDRDGAKGPGSLFLDPRRRARLATVLLVGPSAHQRIRGADQRHPQTHPQRRCRRLAVDSRDGGIRHRDRSGHYLVSALVFEDVLAVIVTILIVGVTAWAWFYLPVVTFSKDDRLQEDASEQSPP